MFAPRDLRHDRNTRELTHGVSGNFEEGELTGWTPVEGDSFKDRSTRVRSRRHKGYQGRYLLASTKKGTGRIRSKAFTLSQPRLTYLMGVHGRGGGLRILNGDRVLLERRSPPTRRTRLRRGEVDLSEFVGQSIAIEVFDDDPKGQVFVDDLRVTAQ